MEHQPDPRNGADVTWHAEPFAISTGAYVDRATNADVEADSRLTLREALVFGRTGETGGTLHTRTRISYAAAPALVEDLDLSPNTRDSPASVGGRRCVDTITTVGRRLPDGPGVLQANCDASVSRWLGDELHRSDQGTTWAGSFVEAGYN